MPIYEYRCADCDRSFETLVRAGDEAAECPGCHGGNIARELSVFASSRAGAAAGGAAGPMSGASNGGGCCGGGCGCR
jgi:putative FmdB family regulatory protein